MVFLLKLISFSFYAIGTVWAYIVPGVLAFMTGENVWLWLYPLHFSGAIAIVFGSWAEEVEAANGESTRNLL